MSVARARIDGRLRRTPILRSQLSTVNGPVDVVFKLEYLQFGGCFKVRGSLNAIVHAQRDGRLTEAGVLVASGGNAAIGAAWAAQLVGTACTVVVPTTAPEVKVNVLRSLGAQVHLVGDRYAHAAQAALGLAQERGALALHAYDLPDVVAGAGTIGLRQAIDAGRPAPVALDSVASDSLGATQLGEICWGLVAGRSEVRSVVVGATTSSRHVPISGVISALSPNTAPPRQWPRSQRDRFGPSLIRRCASCSAGPTQPWTSEPQQFSTRPATSQLTSKSLAAAQRKVVDVSEIRTRNSPTRRGIDADSAAAPEQQQPPGPGPRPADPSSAPGAPLRSAQPPLDLGLAVSLT